MRAAAPALANEFEIARGKYLVSIAGCSDCHTPGGMLGSPDMKRYLGGSDVGFSIPGQGVFVGSNLTPDAETGLGKWTAGQIVTAIRKGKRPDGSELSGAMPSASFAHLSDDDANAIAAFLQKPAAGPQQDRVLQVVGYGSDCGLSGAAAQGLQRPARVAEIAGAARRSGGRLSPSVW